MCSYPHILFCLLRSHRRSHVFNAPGGCAKHHMKAQKHIFANALHDMLAHVTEATERLARQRGDAPPTPILVVDAERRRALGLEE